MLSLRRFAVAAVIALVSPTVIAQARQDSPAPARPEATKSNSINAAAASATPAARKHPPASVTGTESPSLVADDPMSMSESSHGLVIERRRDGSKYAYLQGRFTHVMRMKKNADGSVSVVCSGAPAAKAPAKAVEPTVAALPVR